MPHRRAVPRTAGPPRSVLARPREAKGPAAAAGSAPSPWKRAASCRTWGTVLEVVSPLIPSGVLAGGGAPCGPDPRHVTAASGTRSRRGAERRSRAALCLRLEPFQRCELGCVRLPNHALISPSASSLVSLSVQCLEAPTSPLETSAFATTTPLCLSTQAGSHIYLDLGMSCREVLMSSHIHNPQPLGTQSNHDTQQHIPPWMASITGCSKSKSRAGHRAQTVFLALGN